MANATLRYQDFQDLRIFRIYFFDSILFIFLILGILIQTAFKKEF